MSRMYQLDTDTIICTGINSIPVVIRRLRSEPDRECKGDFSPTTYRSRTARFHHVDRIARLVPLTGVVGWEFDCGLRDSVFGNDKGKLIIAIAFAVETERPFRCRARDFCPDLRCTLPLTFLDNNFLRVENRRAGPIPQLHGNVVIEAVV